MFKENFKSYNNKYNSAADFGFAFKSCTEFTADYDSDKLNCKCYDADNRNGKNNVYI